MESEKKYRNWALGDLFYSDKKYEEEMARIDALNRLSQKDTSTNVLIYIIPIAGLLIMGVIIAVALKKKKT